MKKLACSLLLFAGLPVYSQETRGQILGRVLDQSGAVLVGVSVTVTNTGTNVSNTTKTNETGDYVIPFLLPGTYSITADHPGFKKFVREGLLVQVADRLTVDMKLEVGQQAETVHVTAESPLLESASSSMGQVIDNRRIAELPLKDGNPVMLANLSPGVMNLSTGGWSRAFDVGSSSAVAINGTRTNNNEFSMDGAPNTQRSAVAYIPPTDTVQEFKIQTASFDASLGFSPGAVINLSMKSGTNDLHGASYYFVQNPIFNANKFFANKAGLPKAVIRMSRWGTTANGPVVIPGLYAGKNRTFWMYGYEGIYDADPRGTVTTAVPLPGQLQGNFSSLLAIGPQYQIYDPATIQPAAGGRFSRQPLAGNLIPANRINPVASKIASYWSAPNQAGTVDGSNNWTTPGPEWDHYYTHVFRVDHSISEKHRFFVRGDVAKRIQQHDNRFNQAVGENFYRKNRGFAVDDVYVFSPQFLANFRYSYTRFVEGAQPLTQGMDLASLGFSSAFINQVQQIDPRGAKFPRINVSGYGELGNWSNNYRFDDIHNLSANFTSMVRSHNLRYGVEYRAYRENSGNLGAASAGEFFFATDWTRGPLDSSAGAPMGQSLASFLLGLPSSGAQAVNGNYAEQSQIWSYYLQDDWKLTRTLTVNFGIRHELELPTAERFNRTVRQFDFTSASPVEAQAKANYASNPIPEIAPGAFSAKGGLLFAGVNGMPRTVWETNLKNIMPRFGFAWQASPKMVVRGGYGIFFDLIGIQRRHVNLTGFSRNTDFVASINSGQTFIANLTDPFPSGYDRPVGAGLGLMTNAGQSVSFFNSSLNNPYMQRWQLSVQRELFRGSVIEVGYVGNRGTRQRIGRNFDPIPRQYLSTSPVRDQNTINYLSAAVANPFYPLLPRTSLSGTTVARQQLLRPYPQFTGVTGDINQAYSWYHAMQTRFEKRFSRGYTLNVSWTWSKLMEATGYLSETDPTPERVISDQDRTHRFVASGVWELPFGRGRAIGSGVSGALERLVGGWQLQALYQGQSGAALGFGNSIFFGDLKAIPLPKGERTIQRWFNAAAGFETNSARQLGSNIRTLPTRFSGIRGDGINNWDCSIIKNTSINERIRVQFRTEFINAWNHTQFDNPNTTPSSTAFGTVTAETQWPRTIQFGIKVLF